MEIKLDDGFQFGLGAFETIAVYEGRPVFLERHLRRLQRAAEFLNLGNISERGITEESVRDYLTENKIKNGALKLILSAENKIELIRKNPYTEESYRRGFQADFSSIRRNETSPLVYHKTVNYGDCILEKRAATAKGVNERIFLNTKGQISEGTVSNIFFIKKGKIYTPHISCGLLPGILREYLIENYEVEETVITPGDLEDYEECFVTNSLMGIMPVIKLDEMNFKNRKIADRLREEYEKMSFI